MHLMNKKHSCSCKSQAGSAIILVLAVIVLLSVIVISFVSTSGRDREVASYFASRQEATSIAEEGLAACEAQLLSLFSNAEGKIVMTPGHGWLLRKDLEVTDYILSSGTLSSGEIGSDLNRKERSGDGEPIINPAASDLTVKWVYIYKDGTRTGTVPSAYDANNPVVGRYAFWSEDESGRVNLNTAWKRRAPPAQAARPDQISLEPAIPELDSTSVEDLQAIVEKRPFLTPFESIPALPALNEAISTNRLNLTTTSSDWDMNPFGDPKIVLTTNPARARGRPYLKILSGDELGDPGLAANIDSSRYNTTINSIISLLEKTNWPYIGDKEASLATRYPNPEVLMQSAIDLIDYVRAAESSQPIIEPTRARLQINGATMTASYGPYYDGNTFIGTARSPQINEIGAYISSSAPLRLTVCVELFLPAGFGITNIDIRDNLKLHYTVKLPGGDTLLSGAYPFSTLSRETLEAGGYVYTTFSFNLPSSITERPEKLAIRIALQNLNNRVLDLAPIVTPNTEELQFQLGDDKSSTISREVSDPTINSHHADWVEREGGNSFDGPNSIILKKEISAVPAQDTDAAGKVTNASLKRPPPKGDPLNPRGIIQSSAIIGQLTTGSRGAFGPGVPWRTLRLQPSLGTTDEVPDWALLDLFSPPLDVSEEETDRFLPGRQTLETSSGQRVIPTIAGRININTGFSPFTENRQAPLKALLQDVPGLSASLEETVANIASKQLASSGKHFGSADFYSSIGEICEIQSIVDTGETSEAVLERFIDLTNTGGGSFRLFVVGQSVKQLRDGTFKVQSTKSFEASLKVHFKAGKPTIIQTYLKENGI